MNNDSEKKSEGSSCGCGGGSCCSGPGRWIWIALAVAVVGVLIAKDAGKKNVPVSLLFIDIDNFKYYNDMYGHQRGDDVLRSIALIMRATFPKDIFIARYGGEEFAAIFARLRLSSLRRRVH